MVVLLLGGMLTSCGGSREDVIAYIQSPSSKLTQSVSLSNAQTLTVKYKSPEEILLRELDNGTLKEEDKKTRWSELVGKVQYELTFSYANQEDKEALRSFLQGQLEVYLETGTGSKAQFYHVEDFSLGGAYKVHVVFGSEDLAEHVLKIQANPVFDEAIFHFDLTKMPHLTV